MGLTLTIRECQVSAFGELGEVDGLSYSFALYCVVPSGETASCADTVASDWQQRGVAVFARSTQSDRVTVVFSRTSDDARARRYDVPEMVRTPSGTLLALPIAIDDENHANVSEYYQRVAGEWVRLDSDAWITDLQRRVPGGVDLWKGVWPDLRTLRAEAPLYRPDDYDCCPTGGSVLIQLAVRNGAFVIEWAEFRVGR